MNRLAVVHLQARGWPFDVTTPTNNVGGREGNLYVDTLIFGYSKSTVLLSRIFTNTWYGMRING